MNPCHFLFSSILVIVLRIKVSDSLIESLRNEVRIRVNVASSSSLSNITQFWWKMREYTWDKWTGETKHLSSSSADKHGVIRERTYEWDRLAFTNLVSWKLQLLQYISRLCVEGSGGGFHTLQPSSKYQMMELKSVYMLHTIVEIWSPGLPRLRV